MGVDNVDWVNESFSITLRINSFDIKKTFYTSENLFQVFKSLYLLMVLKFFIFISCIYHFSSYHKNFLFHSIYWLNKSYCCFLVFMSSCVRWIIHLGSKKSKKEKQIRPMSNIYVQTKWCTLPRDLFENLCPRPSLSLN